MARVRALALEGLQLRWNPSDHLGPHFHVEKADEWELRVYFMRNPGQMIEEKWVKRRPAARQVKEIEAAAERTRAALMREWDQRVVVKDPGPEA